MASPLTKSLISHLKVLVRELFAFQPIKDYSDEIWRFFSTSPGHKRKWLHHNFTKYQDTLYWTLNHEAQFEFDLKGGSLKESSPPFFSSTNCDLLGIIKACITTLKEAKKDWLGYHLKLTQKLPKKYRIGLIQRRILWSTLEDLYRPDLELSRKDFALLMKVFDWQEKYSHELDLSSLSLKSFLEYCRVAYLANFQKYKSYIKKKMSGLEMYRAMADGRHEGLVDIQPNSTQAFSKWYHSARGGGHPWEICRGGNTTHIDLGVMRDQEKWFIFLNGNSTGRVLETAKMAIAFYRKNMPFKWYGYKEALLKMEGRDNVGIIPEYHSLHRANQLFDSHEDVFDCLHLQDLGKNKKKIEKLITFRPLEPLCPRSITQGLGT